MKTKCVRLGNLTTVASKTNHECIRLHSFAGEFLIKQVYSLSFECKIIARLVLFSFSCNQQKKGKERTKYACEKLENCHLLVLSSLIFYQYIVPSTSTYPKLYHILFGIQSEIKNFCVDTYIVPKFR